MIYLDNSATTKPNEPFRALFYQMPHSFSRFFLIVAKKRGV